MKHLLLTDTKTVNQRTSLLHLLCGTLFPLGQAMAAATLLSAGAAQAAWVQTHCPANGNILSFAASGSNLFVGISNGGIYLTTDNGINWYEADNGIPTNTTVNALIANGSAIFAGTYGNGVYVSNNGSTWTAADTGLPGNATITAFFANGAYLFAGTYGNGVYLSVNNGASWTAVNNGLPAGTIVNAMTATGTSLFIATHSGIYRSNDNGATWVATNNGMPGSTTVQTILANGNVLYAGTNGSGVYYSSDNGTTWTAFNNGLGGNTNILSLSVSGSEILAGTIGAVYHNNNGTTWLPVSSGLSSTYSVYSITVNGNNIFAGTNNGVWESALPPPAPTYFVPANNATNQPDSLLFTWNSITSATYYAVQVSTDSTFAASIVNNTGGLTTNSYSLSGLTNNTVYFWRVNATNDGGTSAWSPSVKFTTTILAPTAVSPVNNSTNQPVSLSLQWNPVPTATAYSLQVSTDSTFASSIVFSQSGMTSTAQTVSGLVNNTVYFWRVNATNLGGTSAWSVSYRFSTIVALPTAPIPVVPANNATGQPVSLSIGWNPVVTASLYGLQVSTDSTFTSGIVYNSQNNLAATSQSINGLANNTVYYWRVSATNMAGTGPWSTPDRFTTILGTPTPVAPLNNPINQPISLAFTWSAVTAASSYTLQVSTDSTFSIASFYSQSGLATTAQTVSNMANGTVYYWRVNATNAGGTGAWSAVNRFSTIIAVPATPVLALPTNNATGQQVSLSLSWNPVAYASTYNLQLSTDSTFTTSIIDNKTNLTAASQSIGGLSNNTAYYWRVNATNTAGTSPWSAPNRFTTIVGAPTPVAPINNPINQPTSLAFSWSAVTAASSYTLQVSTDSTFSIASFYSQNGLTATLQTVSGMANNTAYYWRVNATNTGGTGAWSAVNRFSTIIAVPTSPVLSMPTNNATGQQVSLSLSWNPVATAGSYGLQVSTDPTFTTSIIYNQSNLTAASQSISSLANNTPYYWRVNATNTAGTSAWSSVNAFTTVIAPPTPESPATTATGQPLSINFQWDPVATATSYALQLSTDSTFAGTCFYNQGGLTATSQTVNNLANNTVYYWRLNATNAGGTSLWSSKYHLTTTLAGPSLVSPAASATNQPVSVKLSWTAVPTATSYSLQVSTDSLFVNSLVYNQNGLAATSQTVSGLANNTVYYWRVDAANTGCTSTWSAYYSFTTAIISPTLVSPANNATGLPTTSVFTWNPVVSAMSYSLQISTTVAFTKLCYNQSGLTDTTQLVSGLANSTRYYWRINATNTGSTGGWSSTDSFTTVIAPPAAPALLTPANNAPNQPVSLSVTWSASGATSYALQISTDSTFSGSFAFNQSGLTAKAQSITGLSNTTVYYWRVTAANAGGTSGWSAPYRFTTVILAPAAIAPAAKATNQPVSLTLSWSSDTMATSYALQVATNTTFATIVSNLSGLTATSQVVSGLSNSTTYYWRVNATTPSGTSAWSSPGSFTTIVGTPAAPLLTLPVNNAVNQSVSFTMTWGTVTGATSYGLQISTDSTFSTSVIFNQSGLTAASQAISGLANNTAYYWRVNAVNIAGNGSWSTVNRFVTIIASPNLEAPANNAAGQSTSIVFQWDAVATASSYGLQVSTDSTFKTVTVCNLNGLSATSQSVQNMANNTVYYWHVNATNVNGASNWSVKRIFTTVLRAPALVSPANGSTDQPVSIKFSWGAVTTATSYSLQIATDSLFTGSLVYNQSGLTTASQTVTTLTNNTVYYWRVNAVNALSTSAWSGAYELATAVAAPTPVFPANNAVNQPVSLTLSWGPVATAATYGLQVATSSTFTTGVAYNLSGLTAASQPVSGLANNTVYFWRVNATNAGGVSGWSASNKFTTIFTAPTLVSPANGATNQTGTSLKFTWNAVSSAVSYGLQISTDSTFATSVVYSQSGITTASQTVGGLGNTTTYYWRANASNSSGGISAWSCVNHFITANSAPTPVSPVNSALQTATFQWDSIPGTNAYALQVSTDSTFTRGVVFNRSGLTTTSQVVSDLASGAVYFWHVNATNPNGTSPWSAPSTFTTVSAAPVMVSPVNNATNISVAALLKWNAIATATAYALQISADSTFGTSFMFSMAATSQSVTGLNNNTIYYWRVNATNAGGTSAWSARYRFATVVAAPSSPNLNGSSGGSTISLILSWDSVANATSYTLQIAKDSTFSSIVYNQSGLTVTSQTVGGLSSNTTYYWRVNAVNAGGSSAWSLPNHFKVQGAILAGQQSDLPMKFSLGEPQYTPSGIKISFSVPSLADAGASQHVTLKLYDLQGHCAATLLDDWVAAGYKSVQFNGKNSAGQSLARGSYVYKMDAPGFMKTKLLLLWH